MRLTKIGLTVCIAIASACSGSDAPSPAAPGPDASAPGDVVAVVDVAPVDDVAAPPDRDASTADSPTPPRDVPVAAPDVGPVMDAGPTTPPSGGRPTVRQMLRRVVHARAFQALRWTVDRETPESVGRALASLRPTYVSGLVRLSSDEMLSDAQRRDFETIRRIVREASPDCQFDVVLNGHQYETPAAMRRKLEAVNDALRPDAWFFDFFFDAYTTGYANPLDAAVAWAHDHHEYIGGNTTGDDSVPRSDYAALSPVSHAGMVADGELDLKRAEIDRLHRRGFPVVMHINNDPQLAPTTESCYFMGESGIARFDWDRARRARWIGERAADQDSWNFRFMYPVFFPECPLWHTYNATRDGDMMAVFTDLVRRFN